MVEHPGFIPWPRNKKSKYVAHHATLHSSHQAKLPGSRGLSVHQGLEFHVESGPGMGCTSLPQWASELKQLGWGLGAPLGTVDTGCFLLLGGILGSTGR